MATPLPARWITRSGYVILAAGIGLRLVRFLDRRPLWVDEAMIALNVLSRPLHGFLRPLDERQVAPLGFLWGEWLVTRLVGAGERAFRFLPLVAGVLGLIAFARLARRILSPGMALLATFLAALSPLLIYYSAEVKSYAFDWLGAVLLMLATLAVLDEPSRRAWMRWCGVAAGSALLSTAAPFFIAGSALALLVDARIHRSRRAVLTLVAAGAPAAAIVGVQLLTVYSASATTSFMQVYWNELFADGVVQTARLTRDFWSSVLFAGQALPRKTNTVVLALSVIGAIAIARRSLPAIVMLLAPAAVAGVASFLEYWPLTPRLLLFAAPAVVITLAAGVEALSRLAPRGARTPVQAILAVSLVAAVSLGMGKVGRTDGRFIGVPDALLEVGRRATTGAAVYLSADMGPACAYYLGWHPDREQVAGIPESRECALRGSQTLVGEWPLFVGLERGAATNAAKTVRPEWLENEAGRILALSDTEIWVLIGSVFLKTTLPPLIEASGAVRIADSVVGGVRVLGYRR